MAEIAIEKNSVLPETGSNEFEIVEFSVGEEIYGINVAKVREVIPTSSSPVTVMPLAHPFVDGIFTLRGRVMPLVNLARCLNVYSATTSRNIIVTEIDNYYIGFLVDNVSRIHRVSWKDVEPTPNVGDQSRVIGVIKMPERVVLLVDFDTIIAEVNPNINEKLRKIDEAPVDMKVQRGSIKIVIAEDSSLLRELLISTLHEAGYNYIKDFNHGKSAWEYLERVADRNDSLDDIVHLVVSDIEMPQMDGHRLLKNIRSHERLRNLPVVLFSSLINDDMRRKGETLGANAQISKPEINQLIGKLDEVLFGIRT